MDETEIIQNPTLTLLDRYRVIELINHGGFGDVFVCWDVRLQRRVAIKVLPLDAGEQRGGAYEEALSEARASSNLVHPNIVGVYDFETQGDEAYLVMEYVDGLSLAEVLSRVENGVLVFDEAAYVARSVAQALTFAHQNGVLHLDVKPSNVLIDTHGNVKLADFGMAALTSAAGWAGARGGTVGYMAPEQLAGDLVDERSDIYALALMVYQMVTGKRPLAAQTAQASYKLAAKSVPAIETLDPDISPEAAVGIAQALSFDASARPSSVEEFDETALETLGDAQAGKESLVSLLQGDEEAQAFDEKPWRSLDPPGRRIPWITPATLKVSRAAIATVVAWMLLTSMQVFAGEYVVGIALACGAITAFLPTAGTLCVAALAVVGLCLHSVTLIHGLLAVCITGLAVLWVRLAAYRFPAASLALFLPALLGMPWLSGGLAGYSASPATAAITVGFSACLYEAAQLILGVPVTFTQFVTTSAAFASMLVGALFCSAVTAKAHITWMIGAQIAAGILVLFVYFYLHQALEPKELLVLVAFVVLMLVLNYVFGPPKWALERKRADEVL